MRFQTVQMLALALRHSRKYYEMFLVLKVRASNGAPSEDNSSSIH
jgi:hypothetical protein